MNLSRVSTPPKTGFNLAPPPGTKVKIWCGGKNLVFPQLQGIPQNMTDSEGFTTPCAV